MPGRGSILRLVWAPASLSEAAISSGTLRASLIGGACGAVAMGAMLSVLYAGIDEPYATVDQYLASVSVTFPNTVVMGAVFCVVVGASTLFFSARTYVEVVRFRSLALAPVCIVVPTLVWAGLAILAAPARNPGLDIVAGLPSWMRSPLLTSLGSGWLGWVIAAALAAIWVRSLRQIEVHFGPGTTTCAACGYDLLGLDRPSCPECGHAAIPPHRPPAEP